MNILVYRRVVKRHKGLLILAFSGMIFLTLFGKCLTRRTVFLEYFNGDRLSNQIVKAWTDYMKPLGFFQLVTQATRETAEFKTLINHIYAYCPKMLTPPIFLWSKGVI